MYAAGFAVCLKSLVHKQVIFWFPWWMWLWFGWRHGLNGLALGLQLCRHVTGSTDMDLSECLILHV